MVNLADAPVTAAPGDEAANQALGRAWWVGSRWAVPIGMSIAYGLLALTADTDLVGKAWMGLGLGLVLVVWFVFRALTETAALARALRVGDPARLFALADRHLASTRRPAARAPFLIGRALGHFVRGEPERALAALPASPAPASIDALAAAVRALALIELERPVAEVRAVAVPAEGRALRWVVDGAIAWRAGQLAEAAGVLARAIDDVLAGSAVRAIAHVYAARVADAAGEPAVAARHRASAHGLAPPDARWLRAEAQ